MQEKAEMFIYTAGRRVNMIEHNGNEETGKIKKIKASNKQSGAARKAIVYN